MLGKADNPTPFICGIIIKLGFVSHGVNLLSQNHRFTINISSSPQELSAPFLQGEDAVALLPSISCGSNSERAPCPACGLSNRGSPADVALETEWTVIEWTVIRDCTPCVEYCFSMGREVGGEVEI